MNARKHLLVDECIVEDVWNLRREVMRPAKCMANPLVVGDRPWDDKSVGGSYVMFDAEEKLFKMWYNVFRYVGWRNEEENWYTYSICYAESRNGCNWDKPELGIVEFEGSSKNNLIMQGEWWATLGTVIEGESDTTNCVFWDDDIGKYVFYMRPSVYAGYWKRRIARAESPDLINWSDSEMVLVPDELDPSELYGMPVFKYEGYYFGLLQMYHSSSSATIEIQLAFSRDGKRWERLPTRDIFLGLGAQHGQGSDFDSGMVISGRPVLVGDELWFYYTGYKSVHTESSNTSAIGLAVAKLDRLIGRATPPGECGLLLTRPIVWDGNTLEINASSANGSIQVEALSAEGEVLGGYEREASMIFSGDSLRHEMLWKNERDLADFRGQRIRLKFYLSNAVLYSFRANN